MIASFQIADDSLRKTRVSEGACSDGHQRCAGPKILPDIIRRPYSTRTDDRHALCPLGYAGDSANADGEEDRPAHTTGALTESGFSVLAIKKAGQGIHGGHGVRPGIARNQSHLRNVGQHR
jgi:hypothetical protein